MPRQARVVSKSGIYHILLRSFNGENIFKDSEDIEKFLSVVESYKESCGFKIYAWCILSGHAHILMQVGEMTPGDIFKRIGGKFVYWYNLKYSRQGPLFQDRYKSEPVENDKYFLTVLRFIHQNPIKHELCNTAEEYELSSYSAYQNSKTGFVDTDYLLSKIPLEQFLQFTNVENDDNCLDLENQKRMNDAQVEKIIYRISKCKNQQEFCQLPSIKRDVYIKKIKDEGVSFRQLSKHTGVGIGVIRRCCDDSSLIPIVFDRILKRNNAVSATWLTNGLRK